MPLFYDKFFLKFIFNKKILDVLNKAFGENFILNLQNCPINRANDKHFGAVWHRDLSYQHFVPSRPIAISALVCVDEFTRKWRELVLYLTHINLKISVIKIFLK